MTIFSEQFIDLCEQLCVAGPFTLLLIHMKMNFPSCHFTFTIYYSTIMQLYSLFIIFHHVFIPFFIPAGACVPSQFTTGLQVYPLQIKLYNWPQYCNIFFQKCENIDKAWICPPSVIIESRFCLVFLFLPWFDFKKILCLATVTFLKLIKWILFKVFLFSFFLW